MVQRVLRVVALVQKLHGGVTGLGIWCVSVGERARAPLTLVSLRSKQKMKTEEQNLENTHKLKINNKNRN